MFKFSFKDLHKMNSTALLLDINSYRLIDWFNIFGSLTAFMLSFLKIREYYQDQIKLKIDIKSAYFTTAPLSDYGGVGGTKVDFLIDIRNKGKQPTTISRIDFYSDDSRFTNLKLNNLTTRHSSFEPIRVEANDRIEQDIFIKKELIYLENCKDLNCTLKFETSHKTITKRLTVPKKNDL